MFLLVHVLEHFSLVNNHPDGVHHMALVAAQIAERIGKLLVEDFHFIDKLVGLSTVGEDVLEAPYLVVFEFDFPSLDLGLIEQLHERVLVVAVIVKRELERGTAGVHTRLGQVHAALPRIPNNTFLGELNQVAHLFTHRVILLTAGKHHHQYGNNS